MTALAERTGGNPFYVRESVRLLASEGVLVALSEVPEGVRDVIRRRLNAPAARMLVSQYGPGAVDAMAVALVAVGRQEEARAVLSQTSPLLPDFNLSIFATLRAMAVVALGQHLPRDAPGSPHTG